MLRLSLPEQLVDDLGKGADKISSCEGSIRVFSHNDADGISAASLFSKALIRLEKPFHLTVIGEMSSEVIESIKKERDALAVFLDIGSGDVESLDALDADVIVLDHHKPKEYTGKVLEINAHRYGIDGTKEASGSTMAFLQAMALDRKNVDLIPLSLSGSSGDRQHIGGFSGVNGKIAELGEKEGIILRDRGLALKRGEAASAIAGSYSPFFRGISGRKEKAEAFLKKLGLDPQKNTEEFTEGEIERLSSALMLKLLEQGCRPQVADELIVWKYFSPERNTYVSDIADELEAASKLDGGLAVAAGLRDEQACYRAKEAREKHASEIMKALLTLEKNGAIQMENIQWFWSYGREVASAQAGIGIQYLLNQEKPVFALTEDGERLKISARGTQYLISRGLNLTEVCREAAESVGGKGGGHNIASGCSIPAKKRKEFLATADAIVGKQIKTATEVPS